MLSRVWLFATPWTVAHQAPLSMEFSRQEYWGALPYVLTNTNSLLWFSCHVVSNSLQPHGLQHTRLPYPSLSPRVCSNSCLLSQWCHPIISSSAFPFSCLQSFPASESFHNESALHIRWPKYWSFSFSISSSNEYSGSISFKMEWIDILAVQKTLKSLLQRHSLKASILQCSAFFRIQLSYL